MAIGATTASPKRESIPFLQLSGLVQWISTNRRPFLVVPRDALGTLLLRVDAKKIYDVQLGVNTLKPLAGMAFFDAWRIVPQFEYAPASQMEQYSTQETPKDSHAFEISWAAVDALRFDNDLRTELGSKDCIDLKGETTLNNIGLATADVTQEGSSQITIGTQQICSRYEGLLKLHFAEYFLRRHATPYRKMKEYQYKVLVMLFRFMSKRIVDFLQPGKSVMEQMYPQLCFLLDPDHLFRYYR